jgi:hypothetical protein
MRRLVITVLLLAAATSTPALACRSLPSPSEIDTALASSQGRLSSEDIAKVQDLREQTSQFLKIGKNQEAQHAHFQAMQIMGMTFVSNGPPSRGCGGKGEWVHKDEAPAR